MIAQQERQSTLSAIIQLANPIFIIIAVGLPVAALLAAVISGNYYILKYVHILLGACWTGIDLFMGFVLGPVLGGLAARERATIFKQLMPRMTFLMPVLSSVVVTAGIMYAQRLGMFSPEYPWIVVSLLITALLCLQGFAILLPNEVRIFQQLLKPAPDVEKISRLGMMNAKLGGLQGVFQLAIIFAMVNLRF